MSNDLGWRGARLSRRTLLQGLVFSASASVLAACLNMGSSSSLVPNGRAPSGLPLGDLNAAGRVPPNRVIHVLMSFGHELSRHAAACAAGCSPLC